MASSSSSSIIRSGGSSSQQSQIVVFPKSEPDRYFRDTIGSTTVVIRVGPMREVFRVHKAVLVKHIPYFKEMFDGRTCQVIESSVNFPSDDCGAFDTVLQWVYTRALPPLYSVEEAQNGDAVWSWDPLDVLHVAYKLSIVQLQNQIISHWITSAKANGKLPAAAIILDVYSKSPVGSGIRKYAARMLHYILSEEEDGNNYWPVEDIKDILHESADLTVDLLTLMRAQVPGERVKDLRDMPLCDFHSHEEGEICIDATPWSVY